MDLAKAVHTISINTYADNQVTFIQDEWYPYEIVDDISGFTKMVKISIAVDHDIYEDVRIYPNLFESAFMTKQEDRDNKIKELGL